MHLRNSTRPVWKQKPLRQQHDPSPVLISGLRGLEVGCTIFASCIASRSSSMSCIWFMSRSPHEKIIFQKHSYSPWRDYPTAERDLDTLCDKYRGSLRLHNLESALDRRMRLRLMNDLHFVCLECSSASLVALEPQSTAMPATDMSTPSSIVQRNETDLLPHLPEAMPLSPYYGVLV